jgi:hypothetical protein
MRLWSIHAKYLDSKGLVALWREALLAQNVLLGKTKGYKNHPQLDRFKEQDSPVDAIGSFLLEVYSEACRRDYNFDRNKIKSCKFDSKIHVTTGQVDYEFKHLLKKLEVRDRVKYFEYKDLKQIEVANIFVEVEGSVESWEVV